MSVLERAWYSKQPGVQLLCWLLAPLTLLFFLISGVRRMCYRRGLLRAHQIAAPVIVVGNISVGGNGKTPLVIRLAIWLRQQGYHPGIVSRGYGGKAHNYPISVEKHSNPAEVGDEPVLMRQHVGCPLVVDPNRPRGAQMLLEQHKCDVVICDDGLQHYALQRDIEIAVVDGKRRFGNGFLLPMGPLREPVSRLQEVDFIVTNGGQIKAGEYLMTLVSGKLVNVKYPNQTKALSEIHKPAIAIAAIGHPQRFFDVLHARQVKLKACLSFADHHKFTIQDIPRETVLMTEKDAVKCKEFAHEDWWYLPVSATLSEQFKNELLTKLNSFKYK